MAYGTPADPVSGTVITSTYAVSNLLNPIRQLRSNTGGAEPPGADYVAVSDAVGGPTSWRKVPFSALVEVPWAASNDGVGSNLDADLWRGLTPATMTVGAATFATSANVAVSANTAGTATSATSAASATNASNSAALGGVAASGYALVARGVPSGLIAQFATAAAIASGWSRYLAGDGRILVGAGSSFSQTFVESNNYGSSWTPAASVSANNGTLSASAGNTGQASLNDHAAAGGTGVPGNVHTHPGSTITLSGSVALAGTGTAWLPAMWCVVSAQKS